jgi:Uma2 family endonuclease
MIEVGVLSEDEKFELIEGEIVMMASKGIAHERIKSALTVAVVRAVPEHLTIGVEATLRLTDMVLLESDIAVFPRELFKKSSDGFAQLDPGEACLVIEVAASSLAYDKGLKARLYARHRSESSG